MTLLNLLKDCWNAQRDTQSLRLFIESRGLARYARGSIAVLTLLSAFVGAASLATPAGADDRFSRAIVAGMVVGSCLWAVRWSVWQWPSFRESVAFLVYADLSIMFVCLADSDALSGLLGSALLVLTGTYTSLMLGTRMMFAHIVCSAVAIAVLASQVASDPDHDLVQATAKSTVLVTLVVVLPVVVDLVVHLIRTDADMSLTDPLTGLSNLRGMRARLSVLEQHARLAPPPPVVAVIVLDLDRFKNINDTLGHQVGDEVLIRVARAVHHACGPAAIVARQGGEEFLVLDLYADLHSARDVAHAICDTIALGPLKPAVTASVGMAATSSAHALHDGGDVSDLIARADAAMYRGKALGGNRVVMDETLGPTSSAETSPC
ncbi:diguanylate cyclase (GGDEF)-like protein [Rhodococcus sp. OAS809]|uniref:GGDEF domain-containing protein n=1 Tax=Rhodococcus sp. OAS809 TaxID=2663874 RepID=UPI0017893166